MITAIRNNKPVLNENAVEQQIGDYLRWRGWLAVRQHAGLLQGSNGSYINVGEAGRADWLYLRPLHHCGRCEAFFLECKGNGARTNPKRRAKQLAWAEAMTQSGYLVVQADSLESFQEFYEANYER